MRGGRQTNPRWRRYGLPGAVIAVAALFGASQAQAVEVDTASTIRHMICRMVDDAAAASGLPSSFLTRLIWVESRFRPSAVSPKGAEGVAQFMPGTAAQRGLSDPHDPEAAITHAADFLVELQHQFGNLGLAAAAYNAGSARITKYLSGESGLPTETRNYVLAVTGRSVEDWAGRGRVQSGFAAEPCISVTARLAQGHSEPPLPAFWQARLDQNLSKAIEGLSVLERQRAPAAQPIPTRTNIVAAQQLCDSLQILGAACSVYRR